MEARSQALVDAGESAHDAMMVAAEEAIAAQARRISIPRRFSAVTRQIWMLQVRLTKTRGKRWKRVLHEERFRAGYDFLLLRARENPELEPLAEFWTKIQEDHEVPRPGGRSRTSRRGRPRRRHRRHARQTG